MMGHKEKILKRRIVNMVLLLIFSIVTVSIYYTANFSKAKNIIEISANIKNALVEEENIELKLKAEKSDKGNEFVIILPEFVQNRKVEKYVFYKEMEETEEEKNDIEIIDMQEEMETENDAEIENLKETEEEKKSKIKEKNEKDKEFETDIDEFENGMEPLTKLALENDEIKEEKIFLKARYETKEIKNGEKTETLYNQNIISEAETSTVVVAGYMPENAEIKVTAVDIDNVKDKLESEINENTYIKAVFDIKILADDKEYEPYEFDENVVVNISGFENANKNEEYKIIHLKEEKDAEETANDDVVVEKIENVESNENNVSFEASSFSTYAVLATEKEEVETSELANEEAVEVQDENIIALAAAMDVPVTYAVSNWEGDIATGFKYGGGTAANPYLITSGDELAYLAQRVNANQNFNNIYFQLAADIDLGGRSWTPIGTLGYSFKGIFDGAGHKIFNAIIDTPTTLPAAGTYYSYGIFGSIGNGNNQTIIRNVEFDSITINVRGSGNTANNNNDKGWRLGIVTGSMYNKSQILNCIVKNSTITSANNISVRTYGTQFAAGGIAGYATNTSTSTTDPGAGNRYSIENCFSDVNMALSKVALYTTNSTREAQYHVGGIIGTIRGQTVWPQNCFFAGTLASNGMMGPIFGGVMPATRPTFDRAGNMVNIWLGSSINNAPSMSSYYYGSSRIGGKTFNTNVATVNDTPSRVDTSTRNATYFQGINKGLYMGTLGGMLTVFNGNVTSSNNYCRWKYASNTYSFETRFDVEIDDTNAPIYTANVTNMYSTNHTYKWYINNVEDTSLVNQVSITKPRSLDEEYNILLFVNDGAYSAIAEYKIPIAELYVTITKNGSSLVATLGGSGLDFVDINDYTYEWYMIDIPGNETRIDGVNSNVLNNIEQNVEYKVIAKHNTVTRYNRENTYFNGNRVVVFVNYASGNNNNNGFTETTPVKNFSTAYSKLSSSSSTQNIIVVIGSSMDDTNYLSEESNTYAKNAILTGKFHGKDYSGIIRLSGNRFLSGDITFMYLNARGSTSGTGNGFLYCQGHNCTFDEQVFMTNFSTLGSDTGYGTFGSPNITPNFHLMGGVKDPGSSSLSANQNHNKLTIKSGTFGRIIVGGRNDNQPSTTLGSLSNPFTCELEIDIKNSTTPTGINYDANLIVGGKNKGSIYGEITINCISGRVGRIVGGNLGHNPSSSADIPTNSFFGTTTINLRGASVEEVYGGCMGRSTGGNVYYYGTIAINVDGSTVNGNIYGAGSGGATGYSEICTDTYKDRYGKPYMTARGISKTTSTITLNSGSVGGNIFGGGYGYSYLLNTSAYKEDMGDMFGDTFIYINGGTVTGNIYGAGEGYDFTDYTKVAQMEGNTYIEVNAGTINGDIYGAGMGLDGKPDVAKLSGNAHVVINTDTTKSIYGGAKTAVVNGNTVLDIGNVNFGSSIFGGGDAGPVNGSTTVNLNGSKTTVTTANVYGGGKSADVQTTQVNINTDSSVKNVFGGGESASADSTNVFLKGGTATNIYGGSNQTGTVTIANVTVNSGIATNVYGGNNVGGNTVTSNVNLTGGTVTKVYGGGYQASTGTTNVNLTGGTLTDGFGGGASADVTTKANITVNGSTVTGNIYGGSDQSGTVKETLVIAKNGTVKNIYGGNNVDGTTTTSVVNIEGGTVEKVYGGGYQASTGTTNVNLTGGTVTDAFGGGASANVTTKANITLNGTTLNNNIYGGSDQNGTVAETLVTINKGTPKAVFGGNNVAGTTTASVVNIEGGTIPKVYGGGYKAATGTTHVNLNAGTVTDGFGGGSSANVTTANITLAGTAATNIYGGSDQAGVVTNTVVAINSGTVEDVFGGNNAGGSSGNTDVVVITRANNVYGGGNQAVTTGNTNVILKNATIEGSAFGGGNGNLAVVSGNNTIKVEGTTTIAGDLFGGGNAAATGTQTNPSIVSVYITGAIIEGDVYGAANTSTVVGNTYTKVGQDAVNIATMAKGTIQIKGTVFGGGKSNSAGSDDYDFTFQSVIGNTYIDIDANGYDNGTHSFIIGKSIFGAGNAATMTGDGYVNIKNYGSNTNVKNNVSIQRVSVLNIDNCSIYLQGATDRTNEISTTAYSFNRIKELNIKNNTTLYLACGANLLEKLNSQTSTGAKAVVTVAEDGSTTKNVDNRIYMFQGKNLILATETNAHGEVTGMTYVGLFKGTVNREYGIYGSGFSNGDIIPDETADFAKNSFVQAKHYVDHNIQADGFYTKFDEEGIVKVKYIEPTPETGPYYQWIIGKVSDDIYYEDIELIATKYATTSAYVLSLDGLSAPNMVIDVIEIDTSDLIEQTVLKDENTIPNIEMDRDVANTNFGLTMTAGNTGWQSKGTTAFLKPAGDVDKGTVTGVTQFMSDNSNATPTYSFYMGHSKNISETAILGTVTIKLQATYTKDSEEVVGDKEVVIKDVYIVLKLTTNNTFKQSPDYYEGAITPGKKFTMFPTTNTSITSNSSFSAYYALYIGDLSQHTEGEDGYYDNYVGYDHYLVSSCVLPEGSKITMMDKSDSGNVRYYYYIVTAADEQAGRTEFILQDFKAMGSTDEQYAADQSYYNQSMDLVLEEFIFQVDFEDITLQNSLEEQTLVVQLRDHFDDSVKLTVNTDQYPMLFNLYSDKEALKSLTVTANKEYIYNGESFNVNLTSSYQYQTINAEAVYDTTYFEDKLGVQISVFDGGTQLTAADLTGVVIEYAGKRYYTREDGAFRMKIADSIANVEKEMKIDTTNARLEGKTYTFRFDSFGSLDGTYYSKAIATASVNMPVINTDYGLKAELDGNSLIIDKTTGKTLNDNNNLNFTVEYDAHFENAKIQVGLYRRKYDEVYTLEYEMVDLSDYVSTALSPTTEENKYLVVNNPQRTQSYNLQLKDNLKSGTYKFVFTLYDGNIYIGEVEKIIIIK